MWIGGFTCPDKRMEITHIVEMMYVLLIMHQYMPVFNFVWHIWKCRYKQPRRNTIKGVLVPNTIVCVCVSDRALVCRTAHPVLGCIKGILVPKLKLETNTKADEWRTVQVSVKQASHQQWDNIHYDSLMKGLWGKKLKLNKEGDFEVSRTCQKLLLKVIYYHDVYFYHNFMP